MFSHPMRTTPRESYRRSESQVPRTRRAPICSCCNGEKVVEWTSCLTGWCVLPARASEPRPNSWQEYGAFPAINSGNLRALHVFVHADPIDRSQVIESYTFTVRYIRDTENQQVPTGIELGKTGSETVTVGATSSAVQDLIRQINGLCEHLPQLPSRCKSPFKNRLSLTQNRQALRFDGIDIQRGQQCPGWMDSRDVKQALTRRS